MDELYKTKSFIRVKREKLALIEDKLAEIQGTFSVRLQKCLSETSNPRVVFFKLEQDRRKEVGDIPLSEIQSYVDSLCDGCDGGGGEGEDGDGEDSSYDSDQDNEAPRHHDVSRTASDTLGAEFAEYVSLPPQGYLAKVEFGLKLGYTERHVQAALQKLGPNPGQNDLLAELIKLGAQTPPRLGSESSTDGAEEEATELLSLSPLDTDPHRLRHVIIDGSNVAMSHGNKVVFSCRGIKICVDWFRARGHKEITVFVPLWRKESSRPDSPITDQEILNELEREKILVFTPSRHCNGKRIQCYDDRYVVKLAAEVDGIVVSNDNYRDLLPENPEYRKVIEERLLMYSFVNDRFMPPDDPLGRSGPTLDKFLRKEPRRGDPPPPCPYGKKCTYGNKCKFYHPERGPLPHKSVTERLAENAQRHLQARGRDSSPGNQLKGKSLSLPLQSSEGGIKAVKKTPLSRTKSAVTTEPATTLLAQSSSLESIEGTCFRAPPPSYATPPPSMWGPKPSWDEGENLHRKLQRQLTLNPCCDPRLYNIQRQHQAVTRVMSCEPPSYPSASHQHVTRIASAPPSHPTVQICPRPLSSASDPQLNLSAPPPVLPPSWPIPPPATPHPQTFHQLTPSFDEARQRLVYHLSSIFPEEQVQAALRYYPNETNPQKICAAILSMFPPKP